MNKTFKNVGEMLDYFAKEKNIQERFVEKLMTAYPQLFPKDADGNPREPDCHVWCPVGWQPMVEELCENLCKVVDKGTIVVQIEQIKEKFGGLRFYYSFQHPENKAPLDIDRSAMNKITDLIHDAEERSFKICEVTGEDGELRIKGKGYGWLKTLSDGEAGLQGYKTLKEEKNDY
jgi:hypothetical protein